MGDFNINFNDINANNRCLQNLTDILNIYNMTPLIKVPTRVTSSSSTCIDNVIVHKDNLSIYECSVFDDNVSDHYGQYLKVNCDVNKFYNNKKFVYKRNFSEKNINLYCDLLNRQEWDTVLSQNDVNFSYQSFTDIIINKFQSAFPLKKLSENLVKRNKWFTPELLELKKQVSLYADLANFFPEFKNSFSIVNKTYQNSLIARKKYFNDVCIAKANNKGKAVWNIINKCTNKTLTSKQTQLTHNGTILTEEESANKFNDYFIEVATNATSHLGQCIDQNFIVSNVPLNSKTFFMQPVTQLDILNAIKKLKNTNSASEDEISNNILKRVANLLVVPLVHIMNLSFSNGIFPELMKKALIIPLFKKGNSDLVENYRPISLLSSISKIFEIIVNERIMHFMETGNVLHKFQHGFRKNLSTDTALSEFINSIYTSLDKKLITLGLFVDFSKAFDSVSHIILLEKLERYGIRGVTLDWIRSYLSNRTQKVFLNNSTFSSSKVVAMGVPQGSILGPTLFIIFINDLALFLKKIQEILQVYYADDANYLVTGKSLQNVINTSKIILEKISFWCDKNKLTMNKEKTNLVLFETKYSETANLLATQNLVLAKSTKMLGLHIDSKLTWTVHIDHICTKLTRVCYMLKNASFHCSPGILRTLYFGCFHSVLSYGLLHWYRSTETDMFRVFKIQKWAIRIMSGIGRNDSCRNHFKKLNILTVPNVYVYNVLCHTFKNKDNLTTVGQTHNYVTRHKDHLLPERHSSSLYQKSLNYNVCKFYNHLPKEIKTINILSSFKKVLKIFLIKKNCYSLADYFL